MIDYLETAKNEMIDNFIDQFKTYNSIYHYTSTNSFKAILDNRNIWMTDYLHLNDSSEIKNGLDIFKSCLDKYSKTSFYKYILKTDYQRSLINLFPTFIYRTFVFSFSEIKDSKTQWSEYGDNYKGISIGFDTKKIFYNLMGREYKVELVNNNKISGYNEKLLFGKIIYNENIKKKIFEEYFEKIIPITESIKASTGKNQEFEGIFTDIFCLMIKIFPLFKNERFQDENEYRLIVQCPYREMMKTIAKVNEIKYRIDNGILVPYFDYYIDDLYNYITDVVVGPKYDDKLPEITIKEYCESLGIANVKIEKSSIPIN
jgi:hypothetical protein